MKVVKKQFFAWQEDAEMAFLNDMADKGFMLTKVGFGKYTFEETTPQDVSFQLDFRTVDKMREEEYLQIYKER